MDCILLSYKKMLNHFFPVPVYINVPLTERSMSTEIDIALQQCEFKNDWQPDNDSASTTFSTTGETNIIKRFQMQEFEKFIIDHANRYLLETQQPFDDQSITVSESWANTFNADQLIGWHGHGYQPNTISGCYYYRAPVGCSQLKFKSPTPFNVSFPHQSSRYNSIVNIQPEQGMIVLFPSWLSHGTEPNKSKETRISLAFNLSFEYDWNKDNQC